MLLNNIDFFLPGISGFLWRNFEDHTRLDQCG